MVSEERMHRMGRSFYLERRGCLVSQTYLNGLPHDVVRGRFTPAEHLDTAVLCSLQPASGARAFS